MSRFWRPVFSAVLIVAVAASCAPSPTGVKPSSTTRNTKPSANPSTSPISLDPSQPPTTGSSPIIQPSIGPVAPVISNNGSNLIGKVKAPASLISDKGLGLIGNNGGNYRIFALSEGVVPGAEVRLKSADGQYLKDAKGEVLKVLTDINGDYKLPFSGNNINLLVEVTLPGEKGTMTALVPRGESTADRTVNVDFTSTLVMTYIVDQYVKGDPLVLDKLPADVELTTRTKTQMALEGGQAAIPEALTTAEVVDTVNYLRQKNAALNDQLEVVKKLLVAGLSDQGNGFPANDVETDANDVAIGPDGLIYFAGLTTWRVWKKDTAGRLAPVGGSGVHGGLSNVPTAAQPGPGDGGPATSGTFMPQALEFMPDGKLLVLDRIFKRIRQIDTNGTLSTYVADDRWEELHDFALEPDGSLVVASHSAVFRVKPDKTITLVAGEVRPYNPATRGNVVDVGDGGPPSEARFQEIQAVASGGGAIYVYDYNGRIRKITADTITAFAGNGTIGASGDGGPATSAQLHRVGSLKVKPDGTVLITDAANHRIRQVKDGIITTIAGTGGTGLVGDGGPALQATVTEPRGMDLRPDGTLYFTDAGFVRMLANGVITTPVGGLQTLGTKRPADQMQFIEPNGLAYEASRHAMIVTDTRHMYRWTLADNQMECIASSGPAGDSYVDGMPALKGNLVLLRSPLIEPDGAIRFQAADYQNYVSRALTLKDGALTTFAGGKSGQGLSTDLPVLEASYGPADGTTIRIGDTYYYCIKNSARVRSFKAGGTTAAFGGYGTVTTDGTLAKDFDFQFITTIGVGPNNTLLVGDVGAIYSIDMATTQVKRLAGTGTLGFSGDGGPADKAQIMAPEGFTLDPQGRIYFSDNINSRIRRINTDGTITSVAGKGTSVLGGTSVDDGLLGPTGLAFDKDGNLYVADIRHNQIKIIRANQL